MKKILLALALAYASTTHAGYVTNSYGEIYKNSYGECVQDRYESEPLEECGYIKPIVYNNIEISDVLFEFDSYQVNKSIGFKIEDNVKEIRLTGHTDNIGSKEYNMELSIKRANAVKDSLNITKLPITVTGSGEDDPMDTNNTSKGRANNRRVEIDLITE